MTNYNPATKTDGVTISDEDAAEKYSLAHGYDGDYESEIYVCFLEGVKYGRESERERCAVLASTFKHNATDIDEHRHFAQLQGAIIKGTEPKGADE